MTTQICIAVYAISIYGVTTDSHSCKLYLD